jgi:hypothetical protein
MKISKSLAIVLIVIVAIIFIGVGVWVGIDLTAAGGSSSALSPYSAVYLSTGDVYFGKLDWSPSPHMEDAWYIQRGTDAKGDPTVGVYPFSQVAWGPSNTIYFNSQQVIFWTRLSATSSVAQLIANPPAAATAAEQNAAAEVPTNATTTASTTSTVSQ